MPTTVTSVRGDTFSHVADLYVVSCYKCGILYAIPSDFRYARRRDHAEFYCPAGHGQHYTGLTPEQQELQRVRDELARSRRYEAEASERAEAAERSRAAVAGHLTRTRRRLQAGLCPECSQRFPDLERHLHTAHPEHWADAVE